MTFIDPRLTERRNPRTAEIDLATPLEIVDLLSAEDHAVPDAVATQRTAIARAIEQAEKTFRAGGRLFYVGAGTSGRLGILDASECPPTFGSDPEMVQGIIAGGFPAILRAQEGAEDSPAGGAAIMDEHNVGERDVVVGIAASGTTPFVHGAIERARQRNARTAIIACTPVSDKLLSQVDVAVIAIVGPEVVAGSTRLKAGTATKMVLNMISTGAMVRIGKTVGNRMVDLRPSNEKLRIRTRRILRELARVDDARAVEILSRCGGELKPALVVALAGVEPDEAKRLLDAHGGQVRDAVKAHTGRDLP